MADARSFGTKSIWDAVNVDIVENTQTCASTSVKSAWDPVSATASTLPALVHARKGSLSSRSRASSRGSSVISSRASSRCSSVTSSLAESDGFPLSGSTRGHSKLSASRFSSSSSCASDQNSKKSANWFSSSSSCAGDQSVLPGDDFDRFACDENVSGATLPPPPPPLSNKLPSLSGKAWQDATEVKQDPHDVFDEEFSRKDAKYFNATRSATDDDLFSDPFAGMDNTGMPSSLRFGRCQTEPGSPSGPDYNGVPSLRPRQLPSMEQVTLPQGPRPGRHAPRPKPQLAAASSAAAAHGRILEEAEEEAEEEKPALARAATTLPGGCLVPEEPQGPRPANRRPAQAKTASVRLAIAGGEKPEEPMASGGHGGTSTRMSL